MLDMESFMETQSLSEIKDEDVSGKCGMCGQPEMRQFRMSITVSDWSERVQCTTCSMAKW